MRADLTSLQQGAFTATLPADVCFDRELPFSREPKDRRYASITFDLDSGLYVAGALHDTVFMNFDEDGQPVFTNDCEYLRAMAVPSLTVADMPLRAAPELVEPRNYRSSVELLMPGSWETVHG